MYGLCNYTVRSKIMEDSKKHFNKLNEFMGKKLKAIIDKIIFVDLEKDVMLANKMVIPAGISLPIRSEELIKGIKNSTYKEAIPLKDFVDCMVYVIGCDKEFKHNSRYISLLGELGINIEEYIINKALYFTKEKMYFDAYAFFRALYMFSEKKDTVKYNIAMLFKQLAAEAKEKGIKESHELYFNAAFHEFLELSDQYPKLTQAHYQLGMLYIEMNDVEKAIEELRKAHDEINDEELKSNISELIERVYINKEFEDRKIMVLNGESMSALKKLLPLLHKYDKWSELKYFTALAYRKTGNYKKAELMLCELLSEGEDFTEIYNELGLCYMSYNSVDKAVSYFEQAVHERPEDVGYLCNLAVAYLESGEKNRAKEMICRAYKIDKEDEIVNKCRELLND